MRVRLDRRPRELPIGMEPGGGFKRIDLEALSRENAERQNKKVRVE